MNKILLKLKKVSLLITGNNPPISTIDIASYNSRLRKWITLIKEMFVN